MISIWYLHGLIEQTNITHQKNCLVVCKFGDGTKPSCKLKQASTLLRKNQNQRV
jgi:hypothetical protein